MYLIDLLIIPEGISVAELIVFALHLVSPQGERNRRLNSMWLQKIDVFYLHLEMIMNRIGPMLIHSKILIIKLNKFLGRSSERFVVFAKQNNATHH